MIEGLPKYEGVSECKALYQSLLLFQREMDGRKLKRPLSNKPPFRISSKNDFLNVLQDSQSEYVHISAHGDYEGGSTWIEFPKGKVFSDEIADLRIPAKIIFVNACKTWRKDLVNAFLEASTRRKICCIAPKNEVGYADALLFALLFYKKLLVEGCKRIGVAFNYAYSLQGMKGNYRFRWR
jgi:hypothetical protein